MVNLLAVRYAKALMEAADDGKIRSSVDKDMADLHVLLKDQAELSGLLKQAGQTDATSKPVAEFLQSSLTLSPLTQNLLKMITERKRFALFPEIIHAYSDEIKRQKGILPVQVTSARPLDGQEKERIQTRLKVQTNHDVEIEWLENASILGGIKIQIRDRVFDGTLDTRIKQLRDHLLTR